MRLLKFFKRYSKGDGRHKEDPAVFSITKTKSVEMKLTQTEAFPSWEKAIQLAIDGETYPLQPLRVDTLHGLLNFMIS
jgi:diacylglycerol kinase family enzyme